MIVVYDLLSSIYKNWNFYTDILICTSNFTMNRLFMDIKKGLYQVHDTAPFSKIAIMIIYSFFAVQQFVAVDAYSLLIWH
ncbi:hypothetical protein SAMN04488101_1208 [Pedobacter nyackensis]|uniref:Uncharacterized protein n=1 Tax=Pedobacter nyackensis TaxID=475255 RepID=A0A1W2F4K3_9SPHI|nr:hypothetical protein SAMN04488101_1208 [Pedobacter nyackensis]